MSDGFKVHVDWDAEDETSDFPDYIDEVGDLVRANAGMSFTYGRDQSTALAPWVSGQGQFTLDNRDGRFSPRNTSSILYGKVKPARPVTITRTVDAVDYNLFRGHSDDQPINPDLDAQSVQMSLVDYLADFRGQKVTIPLHTGIRTGEAIGYVLDAAGWPIHKRDLDDGATVINWFWEAGTDAATALENLVRSEGPPALLSQSADGDIVFRDRHHRLVRPRSLYSIGHDGLMPGEDVFPGTGVFPDGGAAAVWSDEGLEPVLSKPFSYNEGWSTIVNTATVAVSQRKQQPLQQVWTYDETIDLDSGESTVVTASLSDPVAGAITPVEDTDFKVDGTVTVTLLETSGTSIPIQIEATGAATVTELQLRAEPVQVSSTVDITAQDGASVTTYGAREFPGDLPWCNRYDARAIIDTALTQRAQPLPIVTARFVIGENKVRAAALLSRDLSDRVTLNVPVADLDEVDFFIESISHETTGRYDHAVTFGLEAAPDQVDDVFRLNTAGQGADQGHLGTGVDDPAMLLILDDTGAGHLLDHGFLAT